MSATRAKPAPIGPYSRPAALARLDGRTKESRLLAALRQELTAHCGGQPSAVQRAVIERACWLSLHVAQLDAKAAEGRGLTEHDARTYLAWSGALARLLRQLGAAAKAGPQARTLADKLAERAVATR